MKRTPQKRLTPEQRAAIRSSDEPVSALAKRYGVSHQAVSQLRRRR